MGQAEIYDSYWKEGGHLTEEWTAEFFQETMGVLVGKRDVLDYGCGMGYTYQRPLSRNVGNYLGADVSKVALLNAKEKGLAATLIKDDGTMDLNDNSFDGAVCVEVFEHLWDPLAAAKELHRVLRPDGVLVATVPNFGYLPWRLQALLRAQVPLEPESPSNRYKGVHIRFFNKKMLGRLLQDAGFRDVKVYGFCGGRIWDIFWCAGPFGVISHWAYRNLPKFAQLPFLANWFPNVFAERLRAVAIK
jgi:2-polyprenyl-6-hydroxyphenyl methylase/3-demethylubiquinone-9 3-methyltransferase